MHLKQQKTDNISRVTLFILGIAASKVQFGVVRNKESSIKFTYYHVCMYVYSTEMYTVQKFKL